MDNRKIVISLFFTVFIDMMGFSIIFPLFPNLLKHFQEIDSTSFSSKILFSLPVYFSILKESPYYLVFIGGLISSLYSILQFLFSPIWGRMSDRLGRKKILLFTTFGSMLGYCIWIFSDNFNFFILSRIITGVMGGNISVASASMADISSEKDRAKFMGLIGAGIGLGFIFGPPIGGIVSTFSANTGLQNSFPFLTIFPLTAILAFLLASINFLILIFYYRETLLVKNSTYAKKIHPVLELKSSSSKELPIFCLLYFLFTFAFSGFEFSFNFYLSYFFKLSPEKIGFVFVYLGLIIVLIQGGVIRRISGKISEKKILRFGIFFVLIGFAFLTISENFNFTLFALFFTAVGSALINPSISAVTSVYSIASEQGKNLGILRGFASLARAFSPFVYGWIYFNFQHQSVFITSGFIIFLLFFLVAKIPEKKIN